MPERIAFMTEADIRQIVEIERICFPLPWRRQAFLEELTHRYSLNILIKSVDSLETEHVQAYSCNHVVQNEVSVLRMAVAPERRRSGLASRLLDTVLRTAAARGATEAFLEVRPSNVPAISLYRKFGFQYVGTRPNYYSETGEDALVMMKRLKEIS